jgi:hypothetical protein
MAVPVQRWRRSDLLMRNEPVMAPICRRLWIILRKGLGTAVATLRQWCSSRITDGVQHWNTHCVIRVLCPLKARKSLNLPKRWWTTLEKMKQDSRICKSLDSEMEQVFLSWRPLQQSIPCVESPRLNWNVAHMLTTFSPQKHSPLTYEMAALHPDATIDCTIWLLG